MQLLPKLELDSLAPSALWEELDTETRRSAAEAIYDAQQADPTGRREADRAIAAALRFRESAVRQLPVERRVKYLLGPVRPDDSLASSLLLALHLGRRANVLGTFLDRLEIPNNGGLIAEDFDLQPPGAEQLEGAVDALLEKHAEDEVEVYLASLLALDRETWGALAEVIRAR